MIKRTDEQITRILEAIATGEESPEGVEYTQAVEDTLLWMTGDGPPPKGFEDAAKG